MKLQIDDVKKENRQYFKDGVYKAINGKGNIYCTLDKAIIVITEPYIITEEWLTEKSLIKENINKFIHDFRLYQFNQ